MICGEHVRFHVPVAAGSDVVCASPDCRVIMARRPHVGPRAFGFLIERHRWQRRERAELAERSAREALENDSIREAVSRREQLPASRYPMVVLPAAPHQLEEIPQDRRQRYRDRLAVIIAEAVAGEDDAAAPEQEEPVVTDPAPLAQQFCTLCRGGCCSIGGDRAYLNAATIRRVMRLRPELSPDRICEEYLDRLSERTIAGSCINHTATGCGLPREMRSDICNAFYCKPVRDWQAQWAPGDTPLGALVIQRGKDYWSQERTDAARDVVGVSIVTESGARLLAGPHIVAAVPD